MRSPRSEPEIHIAKRSPMVLTLGALGVVFGDIGTSPLYALRECFSHGVHLDLNAANVLGILSMMFWTIVIVMCLKYMAVVMRADNKGEGGILALMALALGENAAAGRRTLVVLTLGLFGAALLFGDGVITPAISVLSAMEGMKIVAPDLDSFVVPLTILLLGLLFMFQRYGTGRIGVVFGPVILIWFVVIGSLGIHGILDHGNLEVFKAMNPLWAFEFFQNHPEASLVVLGSVFLVVTGGEALYADMGHFGKAPIQKAWFFVAMPALVLNYFGQGSLLLHNPEAIQNPFFMLAPKWTLVPLVILSGAAAVIASQALISGIFSIARQAVQLGFSPRMNIIHTSSREIGQIYIPFVNWALLIGAVWLVITFKESSQLASAYGIAVSLTMVITTVIAFEVSRTRWKWGILKSLLVFSGFIAVDFAFFASNAMKITHGGWFPLGIGMVVYLLMTTWQKGRRILARRLKERSYSIEQFVQNIEQNPPQRVTGNAIYMTGDSWGVPVPLLHNLKHNKVLHSQIAVLTIKTREVPYILKKERVMVETLAPQFYRIIAQYGFMEIPKIKHILEACRERGIYFPIQETTFVLGRETILPTGDATLGIWRERIFAFMSRNAERPTAFFKIPPNQVIEVGIQVEI